MVAKAGPPKPLVVSGLPSTQVQAITALLQCAPLGVVEKLDRAAVGATAIRQRSDFLEVRLAPPGAVAFGYPIDTFVFVPNGLQGSYRSIAQARSIAYAVGASPDDVAKAISATLPGMVANPRAADESQTTLYARFAGAARLPETELLLGQWGSKGIDLAKPAYIMREENEPPDGVRQPILIDALSGGNSMVSCGISGDT